MALATQTIRFYERRGLLHGPRRGPNGYRDYDTSMPDRLRFIRTAKTARLTLVEIASIIALRDDGATHCTHVQSLLLAKLQTPRRGSVSSPPWRRSSEA